MLHSAPADFQPWGYLSGFPMLWQIPSLIAVWEGTTSHISGQLHLSLGRWKVTWPLPSSAPEGFSAWRQGLRAHFQRCHWQWQKEQSVISFIHFLLFLCCIFHYILTEGKKNEKHILAIPTNWLSYVPHSLCNFFSVLTLKRYGCKQIRHSTDSLPELRGLL